MKNKNRKQNRSLRKKTAAALLAAALVLSVLTVSISGIFYCYNMFGHYKELAEQLADTSASLMSAEDIVRYYNEVKAVGPYDRERYDNDAAYRADYDSKVNVLKDKDYQQMLDTLFIFADQSKEKIEIEYIYVQIIDDNQVTYIFDADHTEEQYQLGTVRPVSAEIADRDGLENGIPAFITNTEDDGWLCSCMRPVYDADGNPVALVGVDISMSNVVSEGAVYLIALIILVLIAVAVMLWILVNAINKSLVTPINQLSEATRNFVEEKDERADSATAISKLDIHTGDELETLCDSVKHMERDINDYIVNLTAVTAEKERIGTELELATRIQADMLPNIFPAFPERSDLDIYASMTPAKEVGGDFYDFFLVDDTHLAMVMADVSGKGIPAALFMMMSKILIQNAVMSGKSPAEALMAVNNQICANNREEMFVTVWLGIADLNTGLLIAANAGHEKPILLSPDGNFEVFNDRHGFVIGGMNGLKYRNYEMQLQKGSKLFLYTDGVAEATNEADELYGIERTLEALNSSKDSTPKAILNAVKTSVDAFVGEAPQFDDLTMLCFEFTGSQNEISLDATLDNVGLATDFVAQKAEALPFSPKARNQIAIAVDEIVSNVARYAYGPDGEGRVTVSVSDDKNGLTITVSDDGKPYNPLEKQDPDITLSAEERGVGGYGVFIVKNTMDEVTYEYRNGRNHLTMRKNYSK